MKKIVGLDLGVSSIGWSLIETDDNGNFLRIVWLGSRIIPVNQNDKKEFVTGNAISKNQKKTEKKTQRKGYDRYQQRRFTLTTILREFGMLPDDSLIKLPIIDLWQLRANAATKGTQLSLPEIGRVLYHLNQKRGYKHGKSDECADNKQKEYVKNINQRYADILTINKTIGQFFVDKLKANEITNEKGGKYYTYRIKDQVFPRKAYEAEFDQIIECQKEFYPQIFTDKTINILRNEIIYYQRSLKSCKHLVSLCEFEKRAYKNKDGATVYNGPKVAPRTSPLFQVCKIWESVNNLTLKNRTGDTLCISPEQKLRLFEHLDNNEKLTLTDMYTILGISKYDGWWGGKSIGKGLQGNTTKIKLKKALQNIPDAKGWLTFKLNNTDTNIVDKTTGEIIQIISPDFEKEPLYQLWHTVYSIKDKDELANTLKKKYKIEDEHIIQNLYNIDFASPGFGNKSAKAIRRILPYLQKGFVYSDACEFAGFLHSNSLTTAENNTRTLLSKLPQIKKNELRQPVVEKILNQMINVVNALIDKYGAIDEIRVELARELKQSKDERKETDENIRRREEDNNIKATKIKELPDNIKPSRNRIQKYRMWEEANYRCFYCGQIVKIKEFLNGNNVEVEHVIPKSLLFDDSFSNKVCSCHKCNGEKNKRTAYDYMRSKTAQEFKAYLDRIETSFKNKKISKTKRDHLLASYTDYCGRKREGKETDQDKQLWENFIDRQLRQSQYIAKKAQEILKQVCRNVWSTSGSVTNFVRHVWGYDNILHYLNFPIYKLAGLTEISTSNHKNQKHKQERIIGWSKRFDHRHHAIDALTIACTSQSIIHRLNNLNASRDVMFAEIEKQSNKWKVQHSLLQQWLAEQAHFSVKEVTNAINQVPISFKVGKKTTTPGKRIKYIKGKKVVLQDKIIVPRGALSNESVYGKIKTIEKNKSIKYIFENSDLIFKPYIKQLVQERIFKCDGDIKKAISSLKQVPIFLDKEKTISLKYATCFKSECVIKYSVASLKASNTKFIIDKQAREAVEKRLSTFGNKETEAFNDLENKPIYLDASNTIPIKTVRCFTKLTTVEPIKYNEEGYAIGFVLTNNNHHFAIYTDREGGKHKHIVTFWEAVERKKYGIPTIITNPREAWDKVINTEKLPDNFKRKLPNDDWTYEISLQQNEMFILGMDEEAFQDAVRENDYATLNQFLYKVQNITETIYRFCLNTVAAQYNVDQSNKPDKRFYNIQSLGAFYKLNPHKVYVTLLGEIKVQQTVSSYLSILKKQDQQ